jgi:hypothetical protein
LGISRAPQMPTQKLKNVFCVGLMPGLGVFNSAKQSNGLNGATKNLNQIQRHKDYLFDNNLASPN